jgi:hypothetical protein
LTLSKTRALSVRRDNFFEARRDATFAAIGDLVLTALEFRQNWPKNENYVHVHVERTGGALAPAERESARACGLFFWRG